MNTETTQTTNRFATLAGSYRTADGKAQIEWELKQDSKGRPAFSASGTYDRGAGQCIDSIAKAYPSDATVQRIARVWESYHLNDMRAGCEYQRALGWGHGKEIVLALSDMTEAQKKGLAARNEAKVSRKREAAKIEARAALVNRQSARVSMWKALFPGQTFTTHADQAVEQVAAKRSFIGYGVGLRDSQAIVNQIDGYLSDLATKQFPADPVVSEIFENCMGAPCPVDGYLYGHAWVYQPIPAEVLAEIASWSTIPQATGSLGDSLVAEFLARNGIDCRITLSDTKPATWTPAGHHYRVTLSRSNGGRLVFDFWASVAQAKASQDPTVYDVLSCVAMDSTTPNTLAEFCSEFGGNEDSIKTRQSFNRANIFAKRIRAFFTSEELDALREIS